MRFDPEAFACLLERLSADAAEAGELYERLRVRLIRFLAWERTASPEDIADDVLDRVALRLRQGDPIQNVQSFALGVARMVAVEERTRSARRQAILTTLPVVEPQVAAGEEEPAVDATTCLDRCLGEIAPESRAFLLAYYSGDGRQRIENRKRLAREFDLEMNALRNRALRLREKLEECVARCQKRRQLSRMMNPASGDSKGRKASGEMESLERNEMISYLLDLLPEEQREPVRARLSEDPAYFDAMQDLEHDLCDAYVRGGLDPALRSTLAELERHPGFWQQRIGMARALQGRRGAVVGVVSTPRRRAFLWGALGAAASVAAIATGTLLWQGQRQRSVGDGVPVPGPAVSVTASLVPGVLRDGDVSQMQTVRLSDDTATLRLELEAEGVRPSEGWRAVLRSGSGAMVWGDASLVAVEADRLRVLVPAGGLGAGMYRLQVFSVDGAEQPYEYSFRIVR